jgi:hypothetical protein
MEKDMSPAAARRWVEQEAAKHTTTESRRKRIESERNTIAMAERYGLADKFPNSLAANRVLIARLEALCSNPQPATTETEKIAGRKADFFIRYKRNGKAYFDVAWSRSADAARKNFVAACRQLNWRNVEIISVEPRA